MACVCRILKLAVDFTSFGNASLRAYWKSLQSVNICASGASNGVFYSNAAVELQHETSSPQREAAAALSGENALNLEWKETNSCWVECIELENNSNISIINWVGHTTEKTKVYYIT